MLIWETNLCKMVILGPNRIQNRKRPSFVVQSILSVSLAILLTVCPALCEAGGCGCDAPAGRSSGERASTLLADGPCNDADCPENCGHPGKDSGDNCICRGAVRLDDGPNGLDRVVGSLLDLHLVPAFIAGPHAPSIGLGSSPMPDSGDSRTARALLQNYRC